MSDYRERIDCVVDYIENQICEEISIDEAARRAFMSIPHLYRIFPYIVGCSIGAYIRKRRLSLSLYDLKNNGKRIIDLAVEYGYDSQESYIRAFKLMFGITPGDYRKYGTAVNIYPKFNFPDRMDDIMQPQIITRKYLLAGLMVEIDLAHDFTEIFNYLRKISNNNLDKIENKTEPFKRFGFWMPHYIHLTGDYNEDNSSKRMYFTGVEVSDFCVLPNGFCFKSLPESMFAVFRESVRGEMAQFAYKEWIPNSEYILNENILGDLEVYDDVDNYGEHGECDILIAIQKG